MGSLYLEKRVRARKEHRCQACETPICCGDRYTRITTQHDDGTPCSLAYHTDCREVEVRVNRAAGTDRHADEWYSLHEHVHDYRGREWLCDVPLAVYCRFPEDIDRYEMEPAA